MGEGWPVGLALVANALRGADRPEINQFVTHISDRSQLSRIICGTSLFVVNQGRQDFSANIDSRQIQS